MPPLASAEVRALRRFLPWSDAARPAARVAGLLCDALAVAILAFAVWKMFVAPRAFASAVSAQPAPHATFDRLEGGTLDVTDLRGRVAFLDFYASWCTPCRIELPLVMRWSLAHPAAHVVYVDVAEPRPVAAAFARRYGLQRVALDPRGDARGIFAIEGFPTIVVVDPQGRIRAKWEGLNPAIALAMTNAQTQLSGMR